MKSLAVFFIGAGLVASQSLSDGCKQTFAQVLQSPDASCLNPSGIVGLAVGGSDKAIEGPIDSWLTGLCGMPPCTNQTLANIVTNITTGCANDLGSIGFTSNQTSATIADVQKFYPTVRQLICLKDNSANKLCVTQGIEDIEKATNTQLTFSNFVPTLTKLYSGSGLTKDVICTNCNKAALNILKGVGAVTPDDTSTFTNTCGASFNDGQQPTVISNLLTGAAASSPSSTSKSNGVMGTAPLFTGGPFVVLAVPMLMAVFSGFALLA
jgi:hypothetical protein